MRTKGATELLVQTDCVRDVQSRQSPGAARERTNVENP